MSNTVSQNLLMFDMLYSVNTENFWSKTPKNFAHFQRYSE